MIDSTAPSCQTAQINVNINQNINYYRFNQNINRLVWGELKVLLMLPSHHSIYVLIESVRIYVLIDVYVNLGSLAGGGSTVNHQGQLNI